MIARDREYAQLRDELKGKSVVIWTCNTCARLCNGLGGDDAAERMASSLERDGITVEGILSTSASCLKGKVRQKEDKKILDKADIILTMTCDIGSMCAGDVFSMEAINPFVTLGTGYVDEGRRLFVMVEGVPKELSEVATMKGLSIEPYV